MGRNLESTNYSIDSIKEQRRKRLGSKNNKNNNFDESNASDSILDSSFSLDYY